MLCKLRDTGPNFQNATENDIFTTLRTFMLFRSKVLETSLRTLDVFLYIVWQNGLEDISCPLTWLPPYFNPEEILQSLSGYNFNISKYVNLQFSENIFKTGALYTFQQIFLKITINFNF